MTMRQQPIPHILVPVAVLAAVAVAFAATASPATSATQRATISVPARQANPVNQQIVECLRNVRQLLSIAVALSPSGKIKAAIATGACSAIAGAWLGVQSAEFICRATWFWGPFGAGARRYVSFITGGRYTRC